MSLHKRIVTQAERQKERGALQARPTGRGGQISHRENVNLDGN